MNVEILRLEYPKGTTALGLKKIIYEKVAERNQATAFYPDIAIQNDMYNILIKFGPNPAADDYKMPDIDSDFMKGEFSLTLSKSQFQSVYINNSNLQFIFINPPSLSIGKKGKDKKPVLENFGMSLTNSKIDTTITVRYNEQQRQEVLSGRPAFVEGRETVISNESFAAEFNNFKKNPNLVNVVTKNETDLQQQLAFFKTALTEWAKANNREVSFQGEQLYPKPQASKSTGGARPPSKPTSWFSSGWQKIKSLFSTTKSRVITALTVLGIIGAGTAMYKNWFPGFPGVKFPSTPRTSQQTPAMPGFPQK
jgi:hypothetical protein